MNKEKCRLCLCTTDSRVGVSSSINDESFGAIIKSVFRFVLPTFDTVDGQRNDLPVLVCFQCSNTIRNFHYFSEHVKANQKKIQSKSVENQKNPKPHAQISDNWSLDEIIQHIKRESGEDETITEKDMELVFPCADSEQEDRGIDGNSFPTDAKEELYGSASTLIKSSNCVTKGELVGTLEKMDKRVDVVTKQLGFLIQNILNNQRLTKKAISIRRVSFEFNLIRNVEALESLNQDLDGKEYRDKIFNWLDANIDATDSENRMHQSLDLIFHREFFVQCNWTGRSNVSIKKIGLLNYPNVIKLFQSIGRTDFTIVTNVELAYFFKKKIAHAKQRLGNSCLRKSSCHVKSKTLTK
uniref:ZAD domain-containing protein n=1 Tax=Anopheles atroparvus TaxID=41427 RepID=A0AAG5DE91_ANOAO